MALGGIGARWIAVLQGKAPHAVVPILGAPPLAGLLAAMAVGGSWPSAALEAKLSVAFLAGSILFGFVAAHGIIHVAKGRSPPAGRWVLGAYVLVPAAATVAVALLDASLLDEPGSTLAFTGIAIVAAIPFAIGSIPFLWPGRTPRVVAFGIFAAGVAVVAPNLVVAVQMALDAQVATGWVILALGSFSVHATLLAAILLDGLADRDEPRDSASTSTAEVASLRPGPRWFVWFSRLLLAAAVAWTSVAVVGALHLWRSAAGPVDTWLTWMIGYLLGLSLLALALAALTTGGGPERRGAR